MRKNVLQPFKVIDAGDMSAQILGPATNVTNLDNVTYQVVWSGGGTPIGELFVEVTSDDVSSLLVTPTWSVLDFGSAIAVTGNSGSHSISVNQTGFPWMRLRYEATSGAGDMTAKIVAKQVGG